MLARALSSSEALEHLSLRNCQLPSLVVQGLICALGRDSCLSSLEYVPDPAISSRGAFGAQAYGKTAFSPSGARPVTSFVPVS